MINPNLPRFLSVAEVAKVLGVSPPTVRKMIERNELRAVKWGNKRQSVRIPLDALNQFLGLDHPQAHCEVRSTLN